MPTHPRLYEAEVEPAPLRIIKRSQTVTGRPASAGLGAADEWGMSEFTSNNDSEGSPPVAKDRPLGPLTIHKIRRGRGKDRGSILDDNLSVKIADVGKQVGDRGMHYHSRNQHNLITS